MSDEQPDNGQGEGHLDENGSDDEKGQRKKGGFQAVIIGKKKDRVTYTVVSGDEELGDTVGGKRWIGEAIAAEQIPPVSKLADGECYGVIQVKEKDLRPKVESKITWE